MLWTFAGCHAVDLYTPVMQEKLATETGMPKELSKVSLPVYRVEPPDVLYVEMLKLVPYPPYRVDLYDVLQIQVLNSLPDQPINGYFLVEGEGIVSLGPPYGAVRVAGMTIAEATAEVSRKLQTVLQHPEVSIVLARSAGVQQLTGSYLVQPDGKLNLRGYGMVYVAGKTTDEVRCAIERQLSLYFDSPKVGVEVAGYNSKTYYVICAQYGLGDRFVRFPITGNETVLDALGSLHQMSSMASKTMWIARPHPNQNCDDILPIDWVAISRGGRAETNYQILPGDRLYVVDDKLMATDKYLAHFTNPIERMLQLGQLGGTTINSAQVLGRGYNRERRY
ncbi:MAG: polysaccharide biosynthesis/export family protein [Planctomycetaceae bacterium]|nr:polysaccharide biosynthesis/export family protein [Planctomycetaceae bacterium]